MALPEGREGSYFDANIHRSRFTVVEPTQSGTVIDFPAQPDTTPLSIDTSEKYAALSDLAKGVIHMDALIAQEQNPQTRRQLKAERREGMVKQLNPEEKKQLGDFSDAERGIVVFRQPEPTPISAQISAAQQYEALSDFAKIHLTMTALIAEEPNLDNRLHLQKERRTVYKDMPRDEKLALFDYNQTLQAEKAAQTTYREGKSSA